MEVEVLDIAAGTLGGLKEGNLRGAGPKASDAALRVRRQPVCSVFTRPKRRDVFTIQPATSRLMTEADGGRRQVEDKDLRSTSFSRVGGPGGQSVNTTDSAVRVTHLPIASK